MGAAENCIQAVQNNPSLPSNKTFPDTYNKYLKVIFEKWKVW